MSHALSNLDRADHGLPAEQWCGCGHETELHVQLGSCTATGRTTVAGIDWPNYCGCQHFAPREDRMLVTAGVVFFLVVVSVALWGIGVHL